MRIAVATLYGDPRDTKTWSGTPSNIIAQLERHGFEVEGINAGQIPRNWTERWARIRYRLLQRKLDFSRTPEARHLRAHQISQVAEASKCVAVLHMGTLTLPRLERRKHRIPQYLFCDSTYNLWAQYGFRHEVLHPSEVRLADRLERNSYYNVTHIFAISKYVRDNLADYYGVPSTKITVVGTGLGRIKAYHGDKDYSGGHILFVGKGRFEEKGGLLLLDAFRIAQKTNPKLRLIYAGRLDSSHKTRLDSVPGVYTTGHVSWEELQTLFDSAALFAMPAYNEPWGLVYLEALITKTPILGLRRNSLPEITANGEHGIMAEYPDPNEIARHILRLFEQPDTLREMGLKGQQYVLGHYSWENTGSNIASVLRGNLQ